ncbi:DUF3916 domain-containing protein [Bacillus sp. SJS]|uniref:DUF3916 domain-containing protein n=1 Tax=Bacillus sp. SJS TaxID=1423321 RepID=UPI0004DD155A|nr:DUF3916 domain-containing protein [Bacillus sp. SJS]KZZ84320.1 hypothetical protein AS29_010675 [Bacillus sp. SJS]
MLRKKKVRGKRRMYRNFMNEIEEWSHSLPTPNDLSPTYLGCRALSFDMDEAFNGYENFSKNEKRKLAQRIINGGKELHDLKTEKEKEYRILCYLSFPHLDHMNISIGYTKAGLDSFYAGLNHNGQLEKDYEPSDDPSFLQDEWGLQIPEGLEVKGFVGRRLIDGSMWFVGNVN